MWDLPVDLALNVMDDLREMIGSVKGREEAIVGRAVQCGKVLNA